MLREKKELAQKRYKECFIIYNDSIKHNYQLEGFIVMFSVLEYLVNNFIIRICLIDNSFLENIEKEIEKSFYLNKKLTTLCNYLKTSKNENILMLFKSDNDIQIINKELRNLKTLSKTRNKIVHGLFLYDEEYAFFEDYNNKLKNVYVVLKKYNDYSRKYINKKSLNKDLSHISKKLNYEK